MLQLDEHLKIKRCPHCAIDNPNLSSIVPEFITSGDNAEDQRQWRVNKCARCGGVVNAWRHPYDRTVLGYFPKVESIDESLPPKVKNYLQQAIDSTFAPSGVVMLCTSAVESMLDGKGVEGNHLLERIEKAVKDGLIKPDMQTWAQKVRLDIPSGDAKSDDLPLPTIDQAKQTIAFTKTLAEFLFVLPQKSKKVSKAVKRNNLLKT